MNNTILVTGGAGYIGSHVCKLLAREGYTPVTLDDLSTGHRENVKYGPFVEGSTLDDAVLEKVFADYRPAAVIHFAAKLSVGESVRDPSGYYETNVLGTWKLLEVMRRHGVKDIVFSSSAAVYGTPGVPVMTEDLPLNPINPYGRSKLIMEQMMADYDKAYGIKYVALRYFNAAGADVEGELGHLQEEPTNLIPFAVQVLAGERPKLTIFGIDYPTQDGSCVRDYVHVSDLATAHLKALAYLRDGGASEVLNLGTSEGYSVKDVAQMLKNLANRPLPVVYVERREGDPATLVADASRAQAVLEWVPQYSDLKTICLTAWKFKEKRLTAAE